MTDRELASYLAKVKLTERLDDRTIEDLQGTVAAGSEDPGGAAQSARSLAGVRGREDWRCPSRSRRPIPPPSSEEQAAIISEVRDVRAELQQDAAGFHLHAGDAAVCRAGAGDPPRRLAPAATRSWYALDTLTIKLSYFEQKEDYKLILVNNSMTTQDYKTLGGATSTGDFGSMMREIFEPATQAKFEWDHWGTLRGRRVLAFSYRVAQFRSQWHINYDRKLDIVPAYKGLIYVDKETHHVMRVTLEAEDIPASFPVRRAETVLDYDFQEISGHTFLLPLKATTIMAASDYMTKNDEEFRVYRKYSAESDIKFDVTDVPAPLTDDKTKETTDPKTIKK